VIGRAVNPGLQAALDVHGGCGRVDPPGGHKEQRGKRPKEDDDNEKPSNKRSKGGSERGSDGGSEKTFPKRGFGVRVWAFSHISE
jgi:hypothetical protein